MSKKKKKIQVHQCITFIFYLACNALSTPKETCIYHFLYLGFLNKGFKAINFSTFNILRKMLGVLILLGGYYFLKNR
jgi:hypothetical protein